MFSLERRNFFVFGGGFVSTVRHHHETSPVSGREKSPCIERCDYEMIKTAPGGWMDVDVDGGRRR